MLWRGDRNELALRSEPSQYQVGFLFEIKAQPPDFLEQFSSSFPFFNPLFNRAKTIIFGILHQHCSYLMDLFLPKDAVHSDPLPNALDPPYNGVTVNRLLFVTINWRLQILADQPVPVNPFSAFPDRHGNHPKVADVFVLIEMQLKVIEAGMFVD